MMAAAGRESHRSAEKKLLSPPAAVNPLIGGARSYSKDESIVGDGAVGLGTAGLEAEVGNVDELFKAKPEQQQKLKKGSEPFKGGGGALKSPSGGRSSTKSSPPTENSTAAATGEAGGGGDANKAPTRERTQQMYEIYRQTQVSESTATSKDWPLNQAELVCIHHSSFVGCVSVITRSSVPWPSRDISQPFSFSCRSLAVFINE